MKENRLVEGASSPLSIVVVAVLKIPLIHRVCIGINIEITCRVPIMNQWHGFKG